MSIVVADNNKYCVCSYNSDQPLSNMVENNELNVLWKNMLVEITTASEGCKCEKFSDLTKFANAIGLQKTSDEVTMSARINKPKNVTSPFKIG